MAGNIACGRRVRKDFSKIPSIVEIPNLIEIQQQSYEQFLQKDLASEKREEMGLQAVFKSVFPIADYNGNATLEFHSYHFGDPKYTVEECHDRGMTFAIPLKVTLRLKVVDKGDAALHNQAIRLRGEGKVYKVKRRIQPQEIGGECQGVAILWDQVEHFCHDDATQVAEADPQIQQQRVMMIADEDKHLLIDLGLDSILLQKPDELLGHLDRRTSVHHKERPCLSTRVHRERVLTDWPRVLLALELSPQRACHGL